MVQGEKSKPDECVILVKAQPHRSSKYFETVCCAGVGRDQKWRRQYPVPFRILNDGQKFGRWQWISYESVSPEDDKRIESQKVIAHSIQAQGQMRPTERANFLAPLVRSSFAEADAKRESLTLIRPRELAISAIPKSDAQLAEEAQKHRLLADQLSFFDSTAEPLKPCRMRFVVNWKDQDSKDHRQECDDWETSAAFNRFERQYGQNRAIEIIKEKYEEIYFHAGLVLGFSTHSRRNVENNTSNQWLLVGLIRLDETAQTTLLI